MDYLASQSQTEVTGTKFCCWQPI